MVDRGAIALQPVDTHITMTVQWFVTGASLLAALVAWAQARRMARRLDQLSKMYWELKYQYGELRVRMDRLAPPADPRTHEVPAGDRPGAAFVPLASLKR